MSTLPHTRQLSTTRKLDGEKGKKQLQFDTEWTRDRIEENRLVDDIRRKVGVWRAGGYYRERDIVSAEAMEQLGQAKILITNFHAFALRERVAAGKLTKDILAGGGPSPFTETPDQMVRRVCRELGGKRNIVVLNDEAHHCYRRKPDGEDAELSGEDRREAEKRDEEARVWISGVEAVRDKIGVKTIYDLSATPFFLRGSGWPEGTLFPWVVSDFSLIDSIEAVGLIRSGGHNLPTQGVRALTHTCTYTSGRSGVPLMRAT